jgi:hypothetical protein
LTFVSQVVSPARGQSLLPDLPSLVVTQLPGGGSVESYFNSSATGPNQWHLVFTGTPEQLATVDPTVSASRDGQPLRVLRQLRFGPSHYSEIVDLTPGPWHFVISTPFGNRHITVTLHRRVG